MIFQEHESQALNEWLVQELEHICDADPKVLADYVLALLKNDASTTLELQETCVESLAEFLGNGRKLKLFTRVEKIFSLNLKQHSFRLPFHFAISFALYANEKF